MPKSIHVFRGSCFLPLVIFLPTFRVCGGDRVDTPATPDADVSVVLRGHQHVVTRVAFLPDGRHLLSTSWDHTVRLWDLEGRREVGQLKGHTDCVIDLDVSPDGRRVATGGQDGTVRLWDLATRQELHRFEKLDNHGPRVAFSPDGRSLLASDFQGVHLWDLATYREIFWRKLSNRSVDEVHFSSNGKRIVAVVADEGASVWEAESGQWVTTFSPGRHWTWSAAFSPDGSKLAMAYFGNLVVYPVPPGPKGDPAARQNLKGESRTGENQQGVGEAAQEPQVLFTLGHFDFEGDFLWIGVCRTRFSKDGRLLLASGDANALWVIDTQQWKVLRKFHGTIKASSRPSEYFTCGAFSPDGRRVAGCSSDGSIWVWSLDPAPSTVPSK